MYSILKFFSRQVVVCAGAMQLPEYATSLQAELTGMELALAALLRAAAGHKDLVPHQVEVTLTSESLRSDKRLRNWLNL